MRKYNFLKKLQTILVTGGLGFIGSHISVSLLKKGYKVLVIDSLINSSEKTFKKILNIINLNGYEKNNFYFRKLDIRDTKLLNEIFVEFRKTGYPIESVIHCAGLKSTEESFYNPLNYWSFNLNSSLSLISVMQSNNCNKLVFSSSATIYDTRILKKKYDENCPIYPLNPYGNNKYAIEKILQDLFNSEPDRWRIASLRYFNPAGAHDSGQLGEDSLNIPRNLFPVMIKVALGELPVLKIYGDDWDTYDGTCIRDYIHIMDLADSHIATLNYLDLCKPQNISINVGTGKGKSVMEVVNTFMDMNKINIPIQIAGRRKGDNPCLVASNDLALNLLDWSPKKNFENICKDSWKFINY